MLKLRQRMQARSIQARLVNRSNEGDMKRRCIDLASAICTVNIAMRILLTAAEC